MTASGMSMMGRGAPSGRRSPAITASMTALEVLLFWMTAASRPTELAEDGLASSSGKSRMAPHRSTSARTLASAFACSVAVASSERHCRTDGHRAGWLGGRTRVNFQPPTSMALDTDTRVQPWSVDPLASNVPALLRATLVIMSSCRPGRCSTNLPLGTDTTFTDLSNDPVASNVPVLLSATL